MGWGKERLTPSIHVQSREDVSWERKRDPQRQEEQRHIPAQPQVREDDDGVVGDDQDAGEHVEPHHGGGNGGSSAVWGRFEDFEAGDLALDCAVLFQLSFHLVELLHGLRVVFVAFAGVEAFEHGFCFIEATFLHEPVKDPSVHDPQLRAKSLD